jgi:hypothetical protein
MFCALELNRRNINRAISDNMLKDLGMSLQFERHNTYRARYEHQ